MSANPIEDNATPKTTGSLEELFRHHLGDEAARPPRAVLWDQIDNSLLVRQNETYRRRLAATRWVAAASLLLATLAGTGWWARRDAGLGAGQLAGTTGTGRTGAPAIGAPDPTTANEQSANYPTGQAKEVAGAAPTTTVPPVAGVAGISLSRNRETTGVMPGRTSEAARGAMAATSTARYAESGLATARPGQGTAWPAAGRVAASADGPALAGRGAGVTDAGAASRVADRDARAHQLLATGAAGHGQIAQAAGFGAGAGGATAAAGAAETGLAAAAFTPAAAEEVSMLATRPASLALNQLAALPAGLAPLPTPALEAVPALHKWRYGASYTAGLFNPNVNFSRAGIAPEYDYSHEPIFGDNSPALTETAAAEYRANLRPGLSQRIALLATRHLKGHWSLATGAEFGQATAQSSSSYAFVGEQLFDLNPFAVREPHPTDFRYRTAGIPIEVRYTNPVKRGWSLYGRLGGVVTALLGVRGEVAGDPEATRTYSITSAGTPYRRLLGTARGAVGVQYRPGVGSWALTAGPTAEVGLTSLNAHPAQNFLHESRAYGFGLEVGVEFGK